MNIPASEWTTTTRLRRRLLFLAMMCAYHWNGTERYRESSCLLVAEIRFS